MTIKTILTCPLGSKCEEIKDGAIHRCAWFIKLAGKNPSTDEVIDEHGCAMSWVPILLIENSQQQRGTSSAIESFRDEMVNSNHNAQQTAHQTALMIAKHQLSMQPVISVSTIDTTKK